jgi:hypothetical protein
VDLALVIAQEGSIEEFAKEPVLSMAAVLLILVSILWIVVSRLITREMRKSAYRQLRRKGTKAPTTEQEMWNVPP